MDQRTWTSVLAFAAVLAVGCGDDDGMVDPPPAVDSGTPVADSGPEMVDSGPEECTSAMFEKYGETAFLAVNDSIIANAVAAPTSEVGTSFQDLAAAGEERVEEFRGNLAAFLVMVYGGPANYSGPSMEDAHAGLAITSDQYDYFVTEVVVPSLAENGVPTSDIQNCFAPPVVDPDFKASIVGQ